MEEVEISEQVLFDSGRWKIIESLQKIDCPTAVLVNGGVTQIYKGVMCTMKLIGNLGLICQHSFVITDSSEKKEVEKMKKESINVLLNIVAHHVERLRVLIG